MSTFAVAGFTVFVLLLFAGMYLSLVGLPGTVVIFADVLTYAAVTGFDRVGFKILLFLLFFSIIAEIIDVLLGMTGALMPMPSKNMFFASVSGAVVGMFILTPLFYGLGTFGGFFLGCLIGILFAEFIRQSELEAPFKASTRAVFIMIGGKMAKGSIALVMIVLSLANIYA
ncbi:MAG: DUF456 domain-containing protein [Syntrophaceae bacterium]|nr:DUF456 domain-containing protein [Syntrophaceae bacterium]